ncbi:MAG: VOC family protein [Balneolaceae bacterium]
MSESKKGIHHISIISGDGQTNAEFYVKTLGLRMVLKTVNQDDPSNYHLFYANGAGQPGSSITFFPWPRAVKGEAGTGQTTVIAFGVPEKSLEFWTNRLADQHVEYKEPFERFGYKVLQFEDPDGLTLEFVFDSSMDSVSGWESEYVSEEYSIRGFWSATLRLSEMTPTAELLEKVLGFSKKESTGNFTLFESNSEIGRYLIIEETGEHQPTKNGRGIVHHIAFRAKNEEELRKMRDEVVDLGLSPTDIIDRHVFKSVYFQSPGGVLFEMASDDPGYKSVVDDESEMGKKLFLPPWLERKREEIESRLPEITV